MIAAQLDAGGAEEWNFVGARWKFDFIAIEQKFCTGSKASLRKR